MQLIDELINGIAMQTGVRKKQVEHILTKYNLDIEKTFHWFNNTTNRKIRNEKRYELVGLFSGIDNEAYKIANRIKPEY